MRKKAAGLEFTQENSGGPSVRLEVSGDRARY
jgi:hypothetical protein